MAERPNLDPTETPFDETIERGVHNPLVIDLIYLEKEESSRVVLQMIELRPWGEKDTQLDQLQEKFNNYLDYVFDGHLVSQYPQYRDIPVTIELVYKCEPGEKENSLLSAMSRFMQSAGLQFRHRLG